METPSRQLDHICSHYRSGDLICKHRQTGEILFVRPSSFNKVRQSRFKREYQLLQIEDLVEEANGLVDEILADEQRPTQSRTARLIQTINRDITASAIQQSLQQLIEQAYITHQQELDHICSRFKSGYWIYENPLTHQVEFINPQGRSWRARVKQLKSQGFVLRKPSWLRERVETLAEVILSDFPADPVKRSEIYQQIRNLAQEVLWEMRGNSQKTERQNYQRILNSLESDFHYLARKLGWEPQKTLRSDLFSEVEQGLIQYCCQYFMNRKDQSYIRSVIQNAMSALEAKCNQYNRNQSWQARQKTLDAIAKRLNQELYEAIHSIVATKFKPNPDSRSKFQWGRLLSSPQRGGWTRSQMQKVARLFRRSTKSTQNRKGNAPAVRPEQAATEFLRSLNSNRRDFRQFSLGQAPILEAVRACRNTFRAWFRT